MSDNQYDFCIGTTDSVLKREVVTVLNRAGYHSSGDAKSIPLFLRLIRTVQPWLAVIDTNLPPGNIKELADIIESDGLAAAIFINTTGINMNRYTLLNWPVDETVLAAVANAVCNEFKHKKRMHEKIASLQQKLNDRKSLDKAKGILMNLYKLNEEEAYRFMQKNSMRHRLSMIEIANLVISSPDSFSSQLQLR